jgi:MOSC domain-containing protein YiiM
LLGATKAEVSGTVHSINVSNGGPHKAAVPSAWIGPDGVEGDRQRNRQVHGGPERAVCLYSLDLIRALQREGHPIAPGSIGENLTLRGVDWTWLAPGAELTIGTITLQLTAYAAPCRAIADSFLNGAIARVSEKRYPGWSRLYARVLAPGVVSSGDPVTVSRHGSARGHHVRL